MYIVLVINVHDTRNAYKTQSKNLMKRISTFYVKRYITLFAHVCDIFFMQCLQRPCFAADSQARKIFPSFAPLTDILLESGIIVLSGALPNNV